MCFHLKGNYRSVGQGPWSSDPAEMWVTSLQKNYLMRRWKGSAAYFQKCVRERELYCDFRIRPFKTD